MLRIKFKLVALQNSIPEKSFVMKHLVIVYITQLKHFVIQKIKLLHINLYEHILRHTIIMYYNFDLNIV